jgi:hypothetical protein
VLRGCGCTILGYCVVFGGGANEGDGSHGCVLG